jgi:hypothetical protein
VDEKTKKMLDEMEKIQKMAEKMKEEGKAEEEINEAKAKSFLSRFEFDDGPASWSLWTKIGITAGIVVLIGGVAYCAYKYGQSNPIPYTEPTGEATMDMIEGLV